MPRHKEHIKNDEILSAFAETGSLNEAAILLKTSRMTLYRRLKESPELRKDIEKTKQEIKSKKVKSVIKAKDETQIVGIMVRQTVKGKILSDDMRSILEATKGEDVTIYSLLIDQLNLRELMAQAKTLYDRKKIDYKEYAILMIQCHKIYAQVTKIYEEIAMKKIGGKTQSEIYEEVYRYFARVFEILEEIANDEKIDRNNITREVKDRIKWYGE
ncbi:MAG: hypothetical protein KAW56_00630 [Candidatus Marinimicrobia bacterium]|nr:hypothetical protein [Candidatus Neomarinimicrobiota bacterium]